MNAIGTGPSMEGVLGLTLHGCHMQHRSQSRYHVCCMFQALSMEHGARACVGHLETAGQHQGSDLSLMPLLYSQSKWGSRKIRQRIERKEGLQLQEFNHGTFLAKMVGVVATLSLYLSHLALSQIRNTSPGSRLGISFHQ